MAYISYTVSQKKIPTFLGHCVFQRSFSDHKTILSSSGPSPLYTNSFLLFLFETLLLKFQYDFYHVPLILAFRMTFKITLRINPG